MLVLSSRLLGSTENSGEPIFSWLMVLVVFLFHHQEQPLLAGFEVHKSTIAPTQPSAALRLNSGWLLLLKFTETKFRPLPFFAKESTFFQRPRQRQNAGMRIPSQPNDGTQKTFTPYSSES